MSSVSKINISKDNNTTQIRSDYGTTCTLSDTIKASAHACFSFSSLTKVQSPHCTKLACSFGYTFWLKLYNKLFKSQVSFCSKLYKN